MVCTWSHHFSLHKRVIRASTLEFPHTMTIATQLMRCLCADFPTKTNHDVIGALCGDVLVM